MKKVKIVGFNGTPAGHCGIKVPIILDDDGFYKKIGTQKKSPINKATFDAYVQEGRITRLPETEARESDAVLYVKESFITAFLPFFWDTKGVNIIYSDNTPEKVYSKIRFQEATDSKIWFTAKNKKRLIKQMDRWAKLLCDSFDTCWRMQGEGKDMNQLLNIAEAINFCAYDKSLHLQGDIRLGLVYKHFGRLDSFDVLCRLFVKQELGLSRDEFETKIEELKEKISRSKQKPEKNIMGLVEAKTIILVQRLRHQQRLLVPAT